jgi:hypothetical protein
LNVNLSWISLRSSTDLIPTEIKYGVYLWGFTIQNQFMPYYVGIAENIESRLCQHINSILSGQYTIFHKDSLLNFTKYKGQKADDTYSNGIVFVPNWPVNFQEFLTKRKKLQEHIDFMVDNFTYTYAVLDKLYFEKVALREIEKKCIEQIEIGRLINTRCGKSKYIVTHSGDKIAVELFKNVNFS